MPKEDQGITDERYVVIPRTLIFLIRDDQDVLLLKGSPKKRLWANKYNGIGGHIERGEDVITSAQREFKEETGLDIDNIWVCAIVNIDVTENIGVLMFILRADHFTGELVSSAEGQLEWVNMEQLAYLPVVEDINTILPRIFRMKRGDPIISVLYDYDENEDLKIIFKD